MWRGLALLLALSGFLGMGRSGRGDALRSEYTPLEMEKCRLVDSSDKHPDAEIDFFKAVCPGIGGYQVLHEGADTRSWLILKKGDKPLFNYRDYLDEFSPGAFPAVSGKVLEWRLRGNIPVGIIFRVEGNDVKIPEKTHSRLIVVRFLAGESCVLGMTSSNEKARQMVDSPRNCD